MQVFYLVAMAFIEQVYSRIQIVAIVLCQGMLKGEDNGGEVVKKNYDIYKTLLRFQDCDSRRIKILACRMDKRVIPNKNETFVLHSNVCQSTGIK